MPRSCEAAQEDSKVKTQKGGEIHHIATDHGPMVQGGRLTAHMGGVHGYGWSPGWGISFRQGAGAASPGSPDLETAEAAEQRGVRENQIRIRGFLPRGVNIGEGGVEGTHQEARRPPSTAYDGAAPGTLLVSGGGPPLASFGDSGRFLDADF